MRFVVDAHQGITYILCMENAHRIAALRAKAASSTFPAEAAAFTAKADQLEAAAVVAKPTARQLEQAYSNAAVEERLGNGVVVVTIAGVRWMVKGQRRNGTYSLVGRA